MQHRTRVQRQNLLLATTAILFCFATVQAKPPSGRGDGGGGSGPNYQVVALDNLEGVIVRSNAVDINSNRESVGYVQTSDLDVGLFPAFWETNVSDNEVGTSLHLLPASGYHSAQAYGINDSAEVVGYADSSTTRVGLYWPSPADEPLAIPPLAGDNYTFALKINADGVICGHSRRLVVNADGSRSFTSDKPVVWRAYVADVDGVPTPKVSAPVALPVPDGSQIDLVSAINNADESGFLEIAGRSTSADNTDVAVIWTVALTEDGLIASPNAFVLDSSAVAYGINNHGEVSGIRLMDDTWEGSVWSGDSVYTLNRARSISRPRARDINDAGVVVGEGDYSKRGVFYNFRAAVWPSPDADMILLDGFLDANSPFYVLTNANAINESGDIVGYGWTGETRAYIAIAR
jgi:hypothetical protein